MLKTAAATLAFTALLLATRPAAAVEEAAVELGAAATYTEMFARAFQAPLGALFWWTSLNPESAAVPLYSDLQPHMFAPRAVAGYQVTVSSPATGLLTLCVAAQLADRGQAMGFAAAANRAKADMANPTTCTPDNGAAAMAAGFPRMAAMVRTIDKRKVLSAASLPAQPLIGLPATGVVDLSNALPNQFLTITNNTPDILTLLQAAASDTAFSLGSSCQTGVPPAGTCEIEVSLPAALVVKKVARVQLIFSNGANAFFSVRGTP